MKGERLGGKGLINNRKERQKIYSQKLFGKKHFRREGLQRFSQKRATTVVSPLHIHNKTYYSNNYSNLFLLLKP